MKGKPKLERTVRELVSKAKREDLPAQLTMRGVPINDIKRAVCALFGVALAAMKSESRFRTIARPRQVAMALAREFSGCSLPKIGARFGGRDHTTVLHACRTVKKLSQSDEDFASTMGELRRLLAEHAERHAQFLQGVIETPTLVTVLERRRIIVEPKPKAAGPVIEITGRLCRIQRCNRVCLEKEAYCGRHTDRLPAMPEGWGLIAPKAQMMAGK